MCRVSLSQGRARGATLVRPGYAWAQDVTDDNHVRRYERVACAAVVLEAVGLGRGWLRLAPCVPGDQCPDGFSGLVALEQFFGIDHDADDVGL
jgi:hypothetical protein